MLLRRTAPTVAVLGATALVLTACGDSNDNTATATETTTTTAAAPGNALPVGGANLPELTQALAGDPCSTQLTDPVTALITYQYGKLGHQDGGVTVTTKPGDGPGTMKSCTFTIAGAAADWTVPTITISTLAADSNPLSTTVSGGKIAPIDPAPADLDIRRGCNESDVLMPKPCTQTRLAYDQAGLQIETMLAATGKTFKDTTDVGRDRLDTGYRTVAPADVTPQFQVSQTSAVGDDWTMRARIATRGLSDASAPIDAYVIQATVTGGGDPGEDKAAAALTKDISSYLGKNTPKIEQGASIR